MDQEIQENVSLSSPLPRPKKNPLSCNVTVLFLKSQFYISYNLADCNTSNLSRETCCNLTTFCSECPVLMSSTQVSSHNFRCRFWRDNTHTRRCLQYVFPFKSFQHTEFCLCCHNKDDCSSYMHVWISIKIPSSGIAGSTQTHWSTNLSRGCSNTTGTVPAGLWLIKSGGKHLLCCCSQLSQTVTCFAHAHSHSWLSEGRSDLAYSTSERYDSNLPPAA